MLNIEGLGRELDPDLDLWATAKPFLEQWMLGQVGPQKLLEQLKAQAPLYAKLLPELLAEQKRTNRLLQGLVCVVIGFALGMVVMQLVVRVRLF